ncbi:tyrosine-type recombinase/integrase [Dokdonella fugitiva]|jgi:integrase|uniref:Integrase n=1 Tax=Dokdonella fugitiva TaxID=328517 RepID=A0A4R2I9R3_9GAMM|nr:integrase arm-type DNA-binding domain-containing protein [Dokdonella fugitiva]TCO41183.1 integrase [Dokdonella fugitiva]
MATKQLTAIAATKAKPREKPYRLAAGSGLYLEIMPTGAKYWRWKYRYAGKEKRLALGVFPEVPLAEATDLRDKARAALRDGRDPAAERRERKLAVRAALGSSFEIVAREWLSKQTHMATTTFDKAQRELEVHAFPWIGKRPIGEIIASELLSMLRRVEERGKLETAQRVKQRCGQIFRYAVATDRAERDPTADLRGALATPKKQHRAAITDPARVGELLRAIDGYSGSFITLCALRLSPLVFARPGEIRRAEWSEIDLERAEWRIPAAKMKMREAHVVPLAPQAVAILADLRPLTGGRRYVFPGVTDPKGCMSENTINAALRRMGYDKAEMTAHGFRAMASTRLNELGYPPDVIERQLAHAERNKVRAAYNRAQHMDARRKMMQAWAEYLDALRTGARIIPINREARR